MKDKNYLTEYFEDAMEEHGSTPSGEGEIVFLEPELEEQIIVDDEPKDAFIVSFSEDNFDFDHLDVGNTEEILSFEEQLDVAEDILEEGIDVLEDKTEESMEDISFEEDTSEEQKGMMLPGMSEPLFEELYVEEDVAEESVETNWADDKDTSKFIDYLREKWDGIPQHNGNSISGCERAVSYLNKLNREISEAVRKDENNALDPFIDEVEEYRVKILQGMVKLKNRIGELKKKVREEGSQKRAEDTSEEIVKEAKSGKISVYMTPFERAISGMLINSVVSAGHPFEEVYDYLKKKFKLTEREELAILQIVMDMGYPIFKDRGTIADSGDGEQDGHGIDFIKNYFG